MEELVKTSGLRQLADSMASSYRNHLPEGMATRADGAKRALQSLEFPTTREEAWKYTRTAQLAKKPWAFQEIAELPKLPVDLGEMPYRMVFLNGHYLSKHSVLPADDGLILDASTGLRRHMDSPFDVNRSHLENAFLALNTAYPQDGFWLRLEKNMIVESPIHIVNIYTGDGGVSQPRNYVHISTGADIRLTEYHIHLGETFCNTVSEINVEDGGKVGIDVVQIGSDQSYHKQQTAVRMGRDTQFTHNNFTLSGKWTRNDTNARISGKGSTCNFHGLYMPSGKEHVDNHTIIDHEEPHCDSNELYRGFLMDQSTGVFNGKVFVRPDAQKTNAFQSNGNILVSDDAVMNSKPELEIYADDVKCSHGSTTGQLDDEAMFYLRTRGLSAKNAAAMLVTAFAEDVLEKLVNPGIRELIEAEINRKLAQNR